jgi:hypothetical protein
MLKIARPTHPPGAVAATHTRDSCGLTALTGHATAPEPGSIHPMTPGV